MSKAGKKKSDGAKSTAEKKDASISDYGSDKIKLLEGLEGVRTRPSMYIGDIAITGLHHLAYEVIDNCIDETLAGYCSKIEIEIQPDNFIQIEDDGRGIPTGIHPEKKIPALELIFTTLHSGGKFDKNIYKVSGGLHGVGLAVVNACSEKTEVTIFREGKEFYQEFSRGLKLTELTSKKLPESEKKKTGTRIRFKPDSQIFKNIDFSKPVFERERILSRVQNSAFLNPKLRILVRDLRDPNKPFEKEFYSENGLIDFIETLNRGKKKAFDEIIYFEGKKGDIDIYIALQYCEDTYYENVLSFVNDVYTENGGTHLTGFKQGLTKSINYFVKEKGGKSKDAYKGDDVREGLTAIVAVKVPEPQFEGQTKGKLGNSEVTNLVSDFLYDELTKFLEKKTKIRKAILDKVELAQKSRLASQKAKDIVRRKNPLEVSKLPGKLADCSSKKVSECELFIVEGDSAGGSAKEARDRRTQAILPLRGKILNVEKAAIHKILENEEIKSLIQAIGVGISTGSDEEESEENEEENGNAEQESEQIDNEQINLPETVDLSELLILEENPIENKENEEIILNIDIPQDGFLSRESNGENGKDAKESEEEEPEEEPEEDKDEQTEEESADKGKKKRKKIGFDLEKLRYGKIIILTDADVDGQHIRTLLLTFFFRYMKKLVKEGHVYIAVPPIYKFSYKQEKKHIEQYSYEEQNLDDQINAFCKKNNIPLDKKENIHIQRYKGLGEMNPEQLAETTIRKGSRKLLQVTFDDFIHADGVFSMLMGDEVGPRKDFIMEHYNAVQNLDV